jgi:DNA-binding XRE family transcriptional regulator
MKSSLNQHSLGSLVKDSRKKAGLTQEVAAMLCGVTKKTFIRVEKGEDVYTSTMFKILDGLGVAIVDNQSRSGNSSEWY